VRVDDEAWGASGDVWGLSPTSFATIIKKDPIDEMGLICVYLGCPLCANGAAAVAKVTKLEVLCVYAHFALKSRDEKSPRARRSGVSTASNLLFKIFETK
jgi:hypothetical protein